MTGNDAAALKEIDGTVGTVESDGKLGRSPGKKTTQGVLDKKDGEAFHLLEAIIDAFEKAHDIDPTIPRLVPISMRRHFGKHVRNATAKPAPAGG